MADDEIEEISLQSDNTYETEDTAEDNTSFKEENEVENELLSAPSVAKNVQTPKIILDPNHPLTIKYQKDLKERLLKLLQETDDQLFDLNKTIKDQEKENDHFAKQAYEFQKELLLQEEKLNKIQKAHEEQAKKKHSLEHKCETVKQNFKEVEEKWQNEIKKDLEYQRKLEDVSFQVVQLTSLQDEAITDAKSLQRAVEKSAKDRENLELQKLRQDLLISRLENDKYNLEDKIQFYKTQWAIKKEEMTDLSKELQAAQTEMELISFEKQQIVHQWKQSLAALEKQDRALSDIRNSARSFDDNMQILNMEITAHKKSVRKELERNEMLTFQLQFRESDIARSERELKDSQERENNMQENLLVLEQLIEITENELQILNDSKVQKEKELEAKERDVQKSYSCLKSLEAKHMDVLHEKITITKSSKYTEKIIKDIRNAISMNLEKGSLKESEKEKLLLEIDNMKVHLSTLDENLEELQKESKQRGLLLDKSEATAVKTREKMDIRRNDYKNLENELQELIHKAGGQELAPYEREMANLHKEISTAEQGKREMEQEYLRFQRELFTLNKQSSVRGEENDMYKKKVVIMEGEKLQLEADITKEEKAIKDTLNRIHQIEKELTHINKMLVERQELQECLLQATGLCKNDFIQALKEAELNCLQKQTDLNHVRKKKRKFFSKVLELQKHIVFWEQKVYLAEETRKIIKSDSHLNELFQINSEIKRLQLKQQHIKKEQEKLVQEMGKAAHRHINLYVEADKQALLGKRRKTPEYVKKRIKDNKKKLLQDKNALENCSKEIESLKLIESELEIAITSENVLVSDMMDKIKSIEYDTDRKRQEKRQSIIKLSFKQKRNKFLQKVKDGTYIRAIRNEEKRFQEISKIQNGVRAMQVIIDATLNEHPYLSKDLSKASDYIVISKEI